MLIYLDNCCYNRPFDDQVSLVIRLETDAKLQIQEMIRIGEHSLCWSFVLDYEVDANPFLEVRNRIKAWETVASCDCDLCDEISDKAEELMSLGLKQMDATHVACAIFLEADCFITTDKRILNKPINEIEVLNPIDFIRRYDSEE